MFWILKCYIHTRRDISLDYPVSGWWQSSEVWRWQTGVGASFPCDPDRGAGPQNSSDRCVALVQQSTLGPLACWLRPSFTYPYNFNWYHRPLQHGMHVSVRSQPRLSVHRNDVPLKCFCPKELLSNNKSQVQIYKNFTLILLCKRQTQAILISSDNGVLKESRNSGSWLMRPTTLIDERRNMIILINAEQNTW